ncbi:MAG: cobalamin-binding protein [Desulfobacteraceae bacterium]|jgi:iron complex transport system substrate-binding protein
MKKSDIITYFLIATMVLVLPALADTRSVTDLLGRKLEVPQNPQRVVALAPSITEIVYALGQQRRLKGVTRFSDYPEAAKHLPRVGSYVHLDIERIAALKPDLCIGVKAGNPLSVVTRLQAMGIPFYAVHPVDLETVMLSIETIGDLLGASQAAAQTTAAMRKRIDRVKTIVAAADRKPRVFVQIGVSPIVSVGSQTFIHQLVTLAGGTNVAAGNTPYPRFSREQVISLAPDIMVITSMARATVFEKVKAEWMQWSAIPAVRTQAVFIAPTNIFDRPTPRLVEGLEQMARYIHPKLFTEQP